MVGDWGLFMLSSHFITPHFRGNIRHKLYHAAQKISDVGEPFFTQDGLPKFCIRPHDIEELTPIATRYGVIDDAHRTFVRKACALPELHGCSAKTGLSGLRRVCSCVCLYTRRVYRVAKREKGDCARRIVEKGEWRHLRPPVNLSANILCSFVHVFRLHA